jgi:fatty-acid desaturase
MATDLETSDAATQQATRSRRQRRGKQISRPTTKSNPWKLGYDWPVLIWIAVIHLTAPLAFFYFTWQGLVAALCLAWLTGSVGVCMGYHRHLTHGSFSTYRPIRWLLAFLGGLSGEGSALTWVANHRKHHLYSD